MSDTGALSAAVAAFIPPVDDFKREFCSGGAVSFVDDIPDPARTAARSRLNDELRAEVTRTGETLWKLLVGIARSDSLAVDLRQFLDSHEANDRLPFNRDWPRLKAALKVAAMRAELSQTPDGGEPRGGMGRKKRGRRRPERTEAEAEVKKENDLYRDWKASGLSMAEFLRARGIDEQDGVKELDRARKRVEKSGN